MYPKTNNSNQATKGKINYHRGKENTFYMKSMHKYNKSIWITIYMVKLLIQMDEKFSKESQGNII